MQIFQIQDHVEMKKERNRRKTIRAADAKEVGVGNPAEETYRYPNHL